MKKRITSKYFLLGVLFCFFVVFFYGGYQYILFFVPDDYNSIDDTSERSSLSFVLAIISAIGIIYLGNWINDKKETYKNAILILCSNDKRAMQKLHNPHPNKYSPTRDIPLALTIEYAGAYNPLYVISGKEFKEIKGDRMPIGIHHSEKENFTNNKLKVKTGDCLYMFSDGYADQFGGPNKKKFKASKFRKLIADFDGKPMLEQHDLLEAEYYNWKGDEEQIDDVLVLGIRI